MMLDTVNDAVTAYFFHREPPNEPRLYFAEDKLSQMVVWGSLVCPYESQPQYTIFPGDGQVGRWTLGWNQVPLISDLAPWSQSITRYLVGCRMRYEDFGTGKVWIWVLTDQIVPCTPKEGLTDLRLGRWPD